jgi:hypothetical protein
VCSSTTIVNLYYTFRPALPCVADPRARCPVYLASILGSAVTNPTAGPWQDPWSRTEACRLSLLRGGGPIFPHPSFWPVLRTRRTEPPTDPPNGSCCLSLSICSTPCMSMYLNKPLVGSLGAPRWHSFRGPRLTRTRGVRTVQGVRLRYTFAL